MKKHLILLFIGMLILSLACQLISQPFVDEVSPTSLPPSPSAIPFTKTPVPATNTPAPTAIPTSEPIVLTDDIFEADIKETCSTDVPITGYENSVFSIGGGSISFRNGRLALWCYGARHQWIGAIEYEGYTFVSDENDPMQFEIVKDVGYRFVGGIGTLTYPDGRQVGLYRPTKTVDQSSAPAEQTSECQDDDGKADYIQFDSPFTSQKVLIDGQISSDSEWATAFCVDMRHYEWGDIQNGRVLRARWWVQNDDEFIYYLVRVVKDADLAGVAADYFWPSYTGTWAHSDGVYVNIGGSYQDLSNWDESNWYSDDELTPPGGSDVEAMVSDDNAFYWFEIKKALNSGDSYDWVLEPGQVIGYSPSDSFLFALIREDSFYSRNLQMRLGER